jgi:hypothetical protein
MEGSSMVETRDSFTVRFPRELLDQARSVKDGRESLNDLVIEAVAHEVRRRQGLSAYEEIVRIRAEIEAQTGLQEDSTRLISLLRGGEERRV